MFISFVIAAKYWEDLLYWNKDFVDALNVFPIKTINYLESTYLGLCNYELYVSEELYK